nr:unnamed protein product [Digitaria exilis]
MPYVDDLISALCWSVPGVIGCLQALEVIKVATGVGEPLCGRMLLFTHYPPVLRLMFDYDSFSSLQSSSKPTPRQSLLPKNAWVTCCEYKRLLDRGEPHLLLDVRRAHHFEIASIPCSLTSLISPTWRGSCRRYGRLCSEQGVVRR